VFALSTVEPNRLLVLDSDSKSSSRRRVCGRHKARKEASFKRMAWVLEGRLSDSVVLGEKVELDLGTDFCLQIGRVILKVAVRTNSDFDCSAFLSRDCGSSKGNKSVGKLHLFEMAM
jgi:hypothetical protein